MTYLKTKLDRLYLFIQGREQLCIQVQIIKYTDGDSRGGIGLVGDISFSLKNISSFLCTVELQWIEHRWLVYLGHFELGFESLDFFLHNCKYQYINLIEFESSYFILKMYVGCPYKNRLDEAILTSTHNILLF